MGLPVKNTTATKNIAEKNKIENGKKAVISRLLMLLRIYIIYMIP